MITNSRIGLTSFGLLVVIVCAYIVVTQEKEIPLVIQTSAVQEVEDFSDYDYVMLDISPTSTPQSITPISQTDAFDAAPRAKNVSNVVGYFAGGAFVISVPEWIVQNWTSTTTDAFGSFAFLPRPTVSGVDFSAIDIFIRPTDELFNAEWLYTQDKKTGTVIATDTYLSFKEDVRIYYINKVDGDRTYLTFYVDGNAKTAKITFDASNRNVDKYVPKIKELVSSLGTSGVPQFDK